MRRVVVTGLGIVSSIGNNVQEVLHSLRVARSGIQFNDDYARRGFRSQVAGTIKLDLDSALDTRTRRFMGDGAAYVYIARDFIEMPAMRSVLSNSFGFGGTNASLVFIR